MVLVAFYELCFDDDEQNIRYRKYAKRILILSLIISIIIFGIVMLSLYVNHKIAQSEIGIINDSYSGKLLGPYQQGSYTLKPGQQLIKLSKVYTSRTYNVNCLSKDQLSINLSISMQYLYSSDYILSFMFKKFSNEGEYLSLFEDIFWRSYILVCAHYDAEEYYTSRSIIEHDMYNILINSSNTIGIGMDIKSLQLNNIAFPTKFSTAITQKQLSNQNITSNTNARTGALTTAQTKLLQAEQTALTIAINANSTANIIIRNAKSLYDNNIQKWNSIGIGLSSVLSSLNNNVTALLKYLQYQTIQKSNKPVINIKQFLES